MTPSVRSTYRRPPARSRTGIAAAAGVLGVAIVAIAVSAATSALWRTELSTHAAVSDAAVLFAVNGEAASAADPTVAVALDADEMQALLDEGRIAVPIAVEALSQGNRGLRYTVGLPRTDETNILHYADLAVFPVADVNACAVDAETPILPPTSSTPVPATYSDTTTPTIEYWCVTAVLDKLPDVGTYTSTATITGTHALGELVETRDWVIDVSTAFAVADEPTHRIEFTYETFRAGAGE